MTTTGGSSGRKMSFSLQFVPTSQPCACAMCVCVVCVCVVRVVCVTSSVRRGRACGRRRCRSS